MKNKLLPIIVSVLFIACSDNSTSKVSTDSSSVVTPGRPDHDSPAAKPEEDSVVLHDPVTRIDCYIKTNGRDTILLQLNISGTNVSGKMKYDNYQYDGSSGTIKGVIEGDILRLWYNFQAEGTNSVRQMYFKSNGDMLLIATGEQLNRGDSSLYKNPGSVTFSGNDFLRKWDCSQVNF